MVEVMPVSGMGEGSFFGGRASLILRPCHADVRGVLVPFPFDELPFVPRRVFTVSRVPVGTVRGGHAHRSGFQCLFCPQGRIEVLLRCDGEEVVQMLDSERIGLLVGPGVWGRQRFMAPDSVLLVFASDPYDPDSYFDGAS